MMTLPANSFDAWWQPMAGADAIIRWACRSAFDNHESQHAGIGIAGFESSADEVADLRRDHHSAR